MRHLRANVRVWTCVSIRPYACACVCFFAVSTGSDFWFDCCSNPVLLIVFFSLPDDTNQYDRIGSDRIDSDPTRFNSIRIPGRVEKKLERRIFLRIRDMHLGEKNVSIEYQNESLIYKDEHVKTSTKLVIETTIYLYRSVARSIHLQWFYALFVASEYVNEKFNQNTKIAQKKHSAAIIVLGLTRKSRKMRINKNYKSI